MAITLEKIPSISVGATDTIAINFERWLDASETISSATVVEVTSSDLTLTNKAVNTEAIVVDGDTVAIGAGVQFSLSGQSATGGAGGDGLYRIRVTPTTNSSPARVVPFDILIQAV